MSFFDIHYFTRARCSQQQICLAAQKCKNIRLVIAGDGEERELLMKLAAECCPAGTYAFCGWVSDMDSFYGEYQAGAEVGSRAPLVNYTTEDVEPCDVFEGGNE